MVVTQAMLMMMIQASMMMMQASMVIQASMIVASILKIEGLNLPGRFML